MNQVLDLKRLQDLGGEFITLTEAKEQLIVTFTDDDSLITALITKSRRFLENYLNISIVYQRISLVAKIDEEWKLPYGPVIGLGSVEDSSSFNPGSGPVVYATATTNWRIDGDLYDPVGCYRQRIVYTAGNFCPEDLKQVMLKVLTHLYENRGKEVKEGDIINLLQEADSYKRLLWV